MSALVTPLPQRGAGRVAIIGAGTVGSTTAYSLLIAGTAREIILINRNRKVAEGHVEDLKDATLFSYNPRIAAGDFCDCRTADVIIIAAGVYQTSQKSPAAIRGLAYEVAALKAIASETRTAGLEIQHAKGATYYGIGAALTRIAGAILRDENTVLTVSSPAPESIGLGSVCLSLPSVVNREGIASVLPISLNGAETQGLHTSADILKRHLMMLEMPAGTAA